AGNAGFTDEAVIDVDDAALGAGNNGHGNRIGVEGLCEFFFGSAESTFGPFLFGDVVGDAADDRFSHTFCAQGVVILPNAAVAGFGENGQQAIGNAVAADGGHVVVKMPAPLFGNHVTHGSVEKLIPGVAKDAAGGLIDRKKAAVEIVRADEITAVLNKV